MVVDHYETILAKILTGGVKKLEGNIPHKCSPTGIGTWRTNDHVADGKRCSILQVAFGAKLISDVPKYFQVQLCITADKKADSLMRE
jgi:hypothetical protein